MSGNTEDNKNLRTEEKETAKNPETVNSTEIKQPAEAQSKEATAGAAQSVKTRSAKQGGKKQNTHKAAGKHNADRSARTGKRKRRRRVRKKKPTAAGIAGTVFTILLFVLAVFLGLTSRWAYKTWPRLNIEETIYHLTAPIEGTGGGIIEGFLLTCLLPSLVLLVLCIVYAVRNQGKKAFFRLKQSVALLSVLVILAECGIAWHRLGIGTFIRNQTNDDPFIEENYADPAATAMEFPEKKRNLVYIFLESMENTFTDYEHGGAFEDDYIPELTELAQENEDFSGSEEGLNGGLVFNETSYTIAGMLAQSSGLPLKVTLDSAFLTNKGRFNWMDTQEHFYQNATVLGDILEDQGYRQEIIMGSDGAFGGRELYYTEHGHFGILDYYYCLENGLIPEGYYHFWGFEDLMLFQVAKARLQELSASDQPFNLTLLTVDTHFEDGYTCDLCRDDFGDNKYANAIACSSRQVSEFVRWIQEQDFYENTTIILCGDHTTMDSDFCNSVDPGYARKAYCTVINSAVEPADPGRRREYSTMDLFPTTLAAMGVRIEGDRLGLGTNLFSEQDTLVEQLGYTELQEKLSHKSDFMDKLADIQVTEELMDQVQATATVDYYRTGDPDILHVKAYKFKSLKEEFMKVELELYSNSAPDDIRKLDLAAEEAQEADKAAEEKAAEQTAEEAGGEETPESYEMTWSGDLDVSGLDLTDVTATLRVTIVNGNTYEAGTFTGDLTEYLKDE